MNSLLNASLAAVAVAVAAPADARSLSLEINMKNYSGHAAYAVAYIVDGNGAYVSTVYAAGQREKYLADLSRWYRLIRRSGRQIDGATGASVGSGNGLVTTVSIPDGLIDVGYVLRVETAVENQQYVPNDVEIPLDSAHNGRPQSGTGYVGTVTASY